MRITLQSCSPLEAFSPSSTFQGLQLPLSLSGSPLGVICILTAPLLWIRVPGAKWGGVLASLLLGLTSVIRASKIGFGITDAWLVPASLVIAYWFFQIDYAHRFEDTWEGEGD